MAQSIKLALGILACLVAFPSADAQDVPVNHWAYKELVRLKNEGLLVGYADGIHIGQRPLSRYEMAVAILATAHHLSESDAALQVELDSIYKLLEGWGAYFKRDAPERTNTASTRNWLEIYKPQVYVLKRLMREYAEEISSLGSDTEKIKAEIDSVDLRFACIDNERLPYDVHGQLQIIGLGGYGSSRDSFGLSVDGRPLGPTQDLTLLNEGTLSFASNNEIGPVVVGQVSIGNMIGGSSGFGNQSTVQSGRPFSEGHESAYIQELKVSQDTFLGNTGLGISLGRLGYSINNNLFRRPDNTPYFTNSEWDDGRWMFDGGMANFYILGASLKIFAGRNSGRTTSAGDEIQPMMAGNTPDSIRPGAIGQSNGVLKIDQTLGANLWFSSGDHWSFNLAHLWLDSDDTLTTNTPNPKSFNRVAVYGGEAQYSLFSKLNIKAGFGKSDVLHNQTPVVTRDNESWWLDATYKHEGKNTLQLGLAYKSIDPLYAAPGSWGRIGTLWNPTDLEGFRADVYVSLVQNVYLFAAGSIYHGRGTSSSLLSTTDKVESLMGRIEWKPTYMTNLSFAYQANAWSLNHGSNKPKQTWLTLSASHTINALTEFRLFWQVSEAKSGGLDGYTLGGPRNRGGLIGTQLTTRF